MSDNKLSVKDLKKNKKKAYIAPPTHADIFQLPFAACVCGPRNRGKSLLLRNLLERDDMLKSTFKKPNYIIIVSPNISVNGDYDNIEGPHVYKYDHYNPNLIDHLITQQSNIIIEHGRKYAPNILLILDDCLDSGALSSRSVLEKIFSRGRHVNIHCVIVSQHMNRISRTMRLNNDYMIYFMPNNMSEVDDFLEQYVGKTERKKMRQYLKDMWNESIYNFIMVDFRTKDITRRFRKNFSEPILIE